VPFVVINDNFVAWFDVDLAAVAAGIINSGVMKRWMFSR
jgi:hypothetical protein